MTEAPRLVDGAPRGHHHRRGHAPAALANTHEVNVGGVPRHTGHRPGQAPSRVANEHEWMVAGVPRRRRLVP